MANGTLKVSNIETSSGSGTITLGQSGETISIPSGATFNIAGTAGTNIGKVLQVVTATDSTQRTTTSTSYVTASNTLTANITPSASSSKVLIMLSTTGFNASNNYTYYTIYRDSTNVASNSSQNELSAVYGDAGVNIVPLHISFLDSPSTTSQVTYQAYMKVNGSTGYFNVNGNTGSIILMEIGA